MKSFQMQQRRSKGFTLIELLIAIAIIALGLFLILGNKNKGNEGVRGNAIGSQAQIALNAVTQVYRNGDFTGLTNQVMIDSHKLPKEMVQGTAIRHLDKDAVTFTPVNVGTGTNNGAQLVWANVSGASCKQVLDSAQADLVSLTVGSTVIKNATTSYNETAATTACAPDKVNITMVAQS